MQFREEAIAAANQAIEQVISSPFASMRRRRQRLSKSTSTTTMTNDYVVDIAEPVCVVGDTGIGPAAEQYRARPDDVARLDVEHGLGTRCHCRLPRRTSAPPRREYMRVCGCC